MFSRPAILHSLNIVITFAQYASFLNSQTSFFSPTYVPPSIYFQVLRVPFVSDANCSRFLLKSAQQDVASLKPLCYILLDVFLGICNRSSICLNFDLILIKKIYILSPHCIFTLVTKVKTTLSSMICVNLVQKCTAHLLQPLLK